MEAFQIRFILRAMYNVLPSPSNLNQWYEEDPTLCSSEAYSGWLQDNQESDKWECVCVSVCINTFMYNEMSKFFLVTLI